MKEEDKPEPTEKDRKEGQCMECGCKIKLDDGNCCWNICNSCRNSVC